jgi:hypothetical protein
MRLGCGQRNVFLTRDLESFRQARLSYAIGDTLNRHPEGEPSRHPAWRDDPPGTARNPPFESVDPQLQRAGAAYEPRGW